MTLKTYLLLAILCTLCSCSTDNLLDEPSAITTPVDAMTKDMAKGSISKEEFQAKVEGKVWYFPHGNKEHSYAAINGDGDIDYSYPYIFVHDADPGHYFKDGKYVCFYYHDPFLPGHNGTKYHRIELDYTYNPNTGLVYAERGRLRDPDMKRFVFYIESVSDEGLVIHDKYNQMYYNTDPNDQYKAVKDAYAYRRCTLKSATDEDAQSEWWDKFTPDN